MCPRKAYHIVKNSIAVHISFSKLLLQTISTSYMQALALQKQGKYNAEVSFTQFYLCIIHHSQLAGCGGVINGHCSDN